MLENTVYRDIIERTEREIKIRQKKNEATLKKWAENLHPLKIGDIVDVTGWSHKGKKMIVDRRWVVECFGWEWRASGRVIKKNGEPGAYVGDWTKLVFEEEEG